MNNKGADQTAQMRLLVGAFVVRKPQRTCSRIEAHVIFAFYNHRFGYTKVVLGIYKNTLMIFLNVFFFSRNKGIQNYPACKKFRNANHMDTQKHFDVIPE